MTEVVQDDGGREAVVSLTQFVRSGDDLFWVRLRGELVARGIDPTSLAYAESWRPSELEYSFLACSREHVFEFKYRYPEGNPGGGEVVEWVDVTGTMATSPHRCAIEHALDLLRTETDGAICAAR